MQPEAWLGDYWEISAGGLVEVETASNKSRYGFQS